MKQKGEIRYIQISAGKGPAECCWVVAQVLKTLLVEIRTYGFGYEVFQKSDGTEHGTLNSCSIRVEGKEVQKALATWKGTIQWIGQSPYRKFHKRKNWFVGVSFFVDVEVQTFNESEVEFQPFRASGPGGQHRNKVETAVRATHKPTGVTATATDSKSQLQNKKAALEKIKLAVRQHEMDGLRKREDELWKEHLSLERGNATKVFEGRKFVQLK